MSAGRVEQIARPAVIYGEPHTPFVAEFIGTVTSSTFLGSVTRVRMSTPAGELAADVASAVALPLTVGASTEVGFPADAARVLPLN
jgi:ABC-type Fe3+/spermidine/putrescine transport system ATPase subunit